MTRGDARAAHCDDSARVTATDQLRELGTQLGRRPKCADGRDVGGERPVARAGHVSCFRIDRLLLAAIPRRSACVDEQVAGRLQRSDLVRRDDGCVVRLSELVVPRREGRRRLLYGLTGGKPSGQAAVEHSAASMTEPAQQPPKARGDRAARFIVRDDCGVAVDAPAPQSLRESLWIR
jgi:hypothetical protein